MYSLIITYIIKKVKHFFRIFPKFVLDFKQFQRDGLILRELRIKAIREKIRENTKQRKIGWAKPELLVW